MSNFTPNWNAPQETHSAGDCKPIDPAAKEKITAREKSEAKFRQRELRRQAIARTGKLTTQR